MYMGLFKVVLLSLLKFCMVNWMNFLGFVVFFFIIIFCGLFGEESLFGMVELLLVFNEKN